MFSITDGKGFHITFENNWTVSVQWGPGNDCSNKWDDWKERKPSNTAEVWVWPKHGTPVPEEYKEPRAYQTPEEVSAYIAAVAAIPRG